MCTTTCRVRQRAPHIAHAAPLLSLRRSLPRAPDSLCAAFELLTAAVAAVDGASVENNRFSVTVHWRLVDPARVDEVEAIVRDVLTGLAGSDLEIRSGKKVFEVRFFVCVNERVPRPNVLLLLGRLSSRR